MSDGSLVALFCGSRDWSDRSAIRREIRSLLPGSIMIGGGARNADRIAREEAQALGVHVAAVPALWKHFGCLDGPRHNEAMLRLRPDVVHGCPLGGSGTAHTISVAEQAGVEVVVHDG